MKILKIFHLLITTAAVALRHIRPATTVEKPSSKASITDSFTSDSRGTSRLSGKDQTQILFTFAVTLLCDAFRLVVPTHSLQLSLRGPL
jgi:hypothetical protein